MLNNPVRITVGHAGQASGNIEQHVVVLKKDDEKWGWLSSKVDEMLKSGQMLIFVKSRASAQILSQNFSELLQKKIVFLHGDLDQGERMQILDRFRKVKVNNMIATDVAARGLDVLTIRTVVSYDCARDIETHTHRIGRTGRAGEKGVAYTLITKEEPKMAARLVENIETAGQEVSQELLDLAMTHAPFRSARQNGTSCGIHEPLPKKPRLEPSLGPS